MRHIKSLLPGIPLMVVVGSVLLLPATTGTAKNNTLVAGTGNFVAELTETTTTLNSCVDLVSSGGTIEFSGVIASPSGSGTSRALREHCGIPIQGTTASTFTLVGATVAGRTGDLMLESTGIFEGALTIAPGVRTRLHFTIRGVSGGLKGATGTGQVVGQASTSGSSNTYYAEILLPN